MATTTNFGWETPDDTDLVKDGAAAIRTALGGVDTSFVDLKGGTTGQVLKKNTNTDLDFVWSSDSVGMTNPMTTTGDTIYSSSGSTPARLAIGSTGNVLTVAGGVPTWAAPASPTPTFIGCDLRKTANQSLSNVTFTAVTFDVENVDTNGFHDNSTNNSRITIPTGYGGNYLFNMTGRFAINSTGMRNIGFDINGSGNTSNLVRVNSYDGLTIMNASVILNLAAGDYVQFTAYQASGGALDLQFGGNSQLDAGTRFSCTYLGA